jgi:hypothetical protein
VAIDTEVNGPVRVGCPWPCYVHSFVDIGGGGGLRLNNPFRLQTPLGDSAESLSLTAPTLDVRAAVLLGDPFGAHHGLSVSTAIAMQGVPQQVVTPAYQFAWQLGARFWWRAHLGASIVTQPDVNLGVEAGSGLAVMVRAGLGVQLGLVYAHYLGAALDQTEATSIPIVGGQVGITAIYEVLP